MQSNNKPKIRQSSLLDTFVIKHNPSKTLSSEPIDHTFKNSVHPINQHQNQHQNQYQTQRQNQQRTASQMKKREKIMKLLLDSDQEDGANIMQYAQEKHKDMQMWNGLHFSKENQDQQQQNYGWNGRKTSNIPISETNIKQKEQKVKQQSKRKPRHTEPVHNSKSTKGKAKLQGPSDTQNNESFQDQQPNQNNHEAKVNQNQEDYDQLARFTQKTPFWATEQHHRDKSNRTHSDPDYDCSTLFIPPGALDKQTSTMKQYWSIKSDNFDKIVLFKLGKFYEMFYEDALKGVKILGLKWMGTKMHTGFPQKSLDKYTLEFTKVGEKVVVVEQMETPEQMNQRYKKDKTLGKTLRRQVTQVLTKGTALFTQNQQPQSGNTSLLTFLPNYLISVRLKSSLYSYCLLDISTNSILMGICPTFQSFKTLLFQTRPVQLLYDPSNLPYDIVHLLTSSTNFLQMVNSPLKDDKNVWHPLNAVNAIKDRIVKKPKIFDQIQDQMEFQKKNLLYSSLAGMFGYLKMVRKFEYVMGAVWFGFYEKQGSVVRSMTLDSQALQHLEIFQTSTGDSEGSLFHYLDKTRTNFGKRLFRRWLTSPLYSVHKIHSRLDSIQDLLSIPLDRSRITSLLKKLPDLQRIVNRLYHYAIKTQASKAVYFEDISKQRLKQFKKLMSSVKIGWEIVEILRKNMDRFGSRRLRMLVSMEKGEKEIKDDELDDRMYFEDEQFIEENNNNTAKTKKGLLPDILGKVHEFQSYIKWEGDTPVPQKGLAQFYDQLKEQQQQIRKDLDKYIYGIQSMLKQPGVKFTHTKERYQLEIPQSIDKYRPNDWIFSSRRKGFSRYVNKETRAFVKKLEKVQNQVKQQLGAFVGFFFEQFRKQQHKWQRFVNIIAQVDCLISMANHISVEGGVRPNFPSSPSFEILQAIHPCLISTMPPNTFIPNSLNLFPSKTMLITGPNMGGKSTLLRTSCILVIMAQVGFYVPCRKYSCQLIDRIFTRIGASDLLTQEKSTFFIELEETNQVLKYGTRNSLAIMDQLGRGTSTFDGMAIAYAVLKEVLQGISCYCMFATHYHGIVQEFMAEHGFKESQQQNQLKCNSETLADAAKKNSMIQFMTMDHILTQNGKVLFTYKLKQGAAQKSFGMNVAKVVGINEKVLKIAESKAQQIHKQIEQKVDAAFVRMLQDVGLISYLRKRVNVSHNSN